MTVRLGVPLNCPYFRARLVYERSEGETRRIHALSFRRGSVSISVRRVVLSGLIAGPIELVLKIIEGELYLNSLFRAAIEPVNPAWMEMLWVCQE